MLVAWAMALRPAARAMDARGGCGSTSATGGMRMAAWRRHRHIFESSHVFIRRAAGIRFEGTASRYRACGGSAPGLSRKGLTPMPPAQGTNLMAAAGAGTLMSTHRRRFHQPGGAKIFEYWWAVGNLAILENFTHGQFGIHPRWQTVSSQFRYFMIHYDTL
eukprot:SAG31_NODE_17455_length_670_cov_0.733800_1_plen_161_part_00